MAGGELDNANPTVINPSELPTHRQRRKKDGSSKKLGIQDVLMAKPSYSMDPFYMSDFSDTDSDDSTVEPIDEQEIYGKSSSDLSFCFPFLIPFLLLVHHALSCVGDPTAQS
jgi:hypothetical protein